MPFVCNVTPRPRTYRKARHPYSAMPEHYSERQAAELLRRAALLQAKNDDARGPGLSLDEVKRAAGAAGIDAQYVEQAALGAGDDIAPSAPFLGIQTGARRTRVVPGRVSDAEWGKMVATLRRQLGGTGEVETVGDVREWRRDPYHVLLESEGENTRITATAGWRADAIGALAITSVFVLFALVMVASSFAKGKPDVLILAAMFGAMAAASGLFTWPRLWPKGARIEGKFERAMDALEEIAGSEERAEALASAPPLAPEAEDEAPRLDLSILDGRGRARLWRAGVAPEAPRVGAHLVCGSSRSFAHAQAIHRVRSPAHLRPRRRAAARSRSERGGPVSGGVGGGRPRRRPRCRVHPRRRDGRASPRARRDHQDRPGDASGVPPRAVRTRAPWRTTRGRRS